MPTYKATTNMIRSIFIFSLMASILLSAYTMTTSSWTISESDIATIQEPFPDSTDSKYSVIWGTNYLDFISDWISNLFGKIFATGAILFSMLTVLPASILTLTSGNIWVFTFFAGIFAMFMITVVSFVIKLMWSGGD